MVVKRGAPSDQAVDPNNLISGLKQLFSHLELTDTDIRKTNQELSANNVFPVLHCLPESTCGARKPVVHVACVAAAIVQMPFLLEDAIQDEAKTAKQGCARTTPRDRHSRGDTLLDMARRLTTSTCDAETKTYDGMLHLCKNKAQFRGMYTDKPNEWGCVDCTAAGRCVTKAERRRMGSVINEDATIEAAETTDRSTITDPRQQAP
ncbi:hypothetical protein RvY_17351 [Ramazzottius varieornatus]|uniref:Uncharacterized protein n=1 Tax=Ramazzottius varieornatus TaxID=947166 RepID=A0A1D1W2N1_RAMVA|nr:hypothetical protein RvY_17351 [Ramazzottius varieornatus]